MPDDRSRAPAYTLLPGLADVGILSFVVRDRFGLSLADHLIEGMCETTAYWFHQRWETKT